MILLSSVNFFCNISPFPLFVCLFVLRMAVSLFLSCPPSLPASETVQVLCFPALLLFLSSPGAFEHPQMNCPKAHCNYFVSKHFFPIIFLLKELFSYSVYTLTPWPVSLCLVYFSPPPALRLRICVSSLPLTSRHISPLTLCLLLPRMHGSLRFSVPFCKR